MILPCLLLTLILKSSGVETGRRGKIPATELEALTTLRPLPRVVAWSRWAGQQSRRQGEWQSRESQGSGPG